MRLPRQRFRVTPYTNPLTGSRSWRVSGTKRDGSRIRENFSDPKDAQFRQVELEGEFLARQTETTLRATRLTDVQVRLAEMAFARLSDDSELPRAIDSWLRGGKQQAVGDSPRLDDAFEKYRAWLPTSGLRVLSQNNQQRRVNTFVNSVPNLRVCDFTHDVIEDFLTKRKVSPLTRDNDRRAISGFFSWCIERPRRWISANPCREIRIAKQEKEPPAVLTVEQCETLLRTAERFKDGKHAPFVAVALFAGLRPFEIVRLNWSAVNLKDREIRLEGVQTKTGRPRVVEICDALLAWLKAYKNRPFFVPGWLKDFRKIKESIGYGVKPELKPWVPDVLRHTAISHYFRNAGSYGKTAEQFGNSESIIKNHYQGRVSSDDTKAFYALRPANHNETHANKKPNRNRGGHKSSEVGTQGRRSARSDAASAPAALVAGSVS